MTAQTVSVEKQDRRAKIDAGVALGIAVVSLVLLPFQALMALPLALTALALGIIELRTQEKTRGLASVALGLAIVALLALGVIWLMS